MQREMLLLFLTLKECTGDFVRVMERKRFRFISNSSLFEFFQIFISKLAVRLGDVAVLEKRPPGTGAK